MDNIIWGYLRILKYGNVGKDACRKILEIRLIRSWKSWRWNQDLQKTRHGHFVFASQLKPFKQLQFAFYFQLKESLPPTHPLPPTPPTPPHPLGYEIVSNCSSMFPTLSNNLLKWVLKWLRHGPAFEIVQNPSNQCPEIVHFCNCQNMVPNLSQAGFFFSENGTNIIT